MVSSLGYTFQFTAPYTHNQLGNMERQWATLADSATAIPQHANCPTKYWGRAMRTAFYLRNRLPSPDASGGSGGVPYTMFHGVPTDLAHLKVFGCTAYFRLEDRYMDKLSLKALRCMFTGYCDDGPCYWILNLASGKLVRTIHVAFVESQPAEAPPTPSVAYGTFQASPSNSLEPRGAPVPISRVRTQHTLQSLPTTLSRFCETMLRTTSTPTLHERTLAILTVSLRHAVQQLLISNRQTKLPESSRGTKLRGRLAQRRKLQGQRGNLPQARNP
jgi:hypothetical protein